MITQIREFFQHRLWQPLPETSPLLTRLGFNTLRVAYIIVRELAKGELNLRAMSLVFTTLLSLVPLIAVAFSVLKAFGVHNQIEPFLLQVFEPLGPKGAEITANIIKFVQNVKVGVLGSVGIAMLFYTIISLIQKIENTFNYVWRVSRSRTLARRFSDYLSVVMIGPVLVVTALGIATSIMNHEVVQTIQGIAPFGTVLLFLGKIVPYIMITMAFTFLYMFIPNTRVEFVPALVGAIVAGFLWISIGKLFASFVATSSSYTAIYSSFAILFFFMIWLYLGWLILLTGTQVAFYLQHPKLVRLGGRPYVLSPRLREQEGLWIMTLIGRAFYQDRRALCLPAIEKDTALPVDVIEHVLAMLQQGGLIIEISGEEEDCYVLATDSTEITIKQILDCLRSAEETDIQTKSKVGESVKKVMKKLDEQQALALAGLRLRDLVEEERARP